MLYIVATAFFVTLISTSAVKHVAIKLGAVTAPRERDVHTKPIPRLGGIAMFLGMAAAILVARFTVYSQALENNDYQLFYFVLGAGLLVLVGAIDDVIDMDWMLKLAGQIGAALLVTHGGIQILSIPIFGTTVGSSKASVAVTVFLIVAVMNAVNFIDGLDGLAAGVAGISASAMYFYARIAGSDFLSSPVVALLIAGVTVGICLGFLPHNFNPAKIFMGDSGSMLLGYMLACSSIVIAGSIESAHIVSLKTLPTYIPILLVLALLFYPLLDMFMAVTRRLARGKSPFSPDKKHIHHRILDLGHSQRMSALLLYMWTALFSYCSLLILIMRFRYVMLIFAIGFVILVLATFLLPEIGWTAADKARKIRDNKVKPKLKK
ncbi:MAG: undecaprenyl/decaprenyl-phosphate alpha-N-acetylglucosaminyl 1-phosphate transferase [Bifidobacteriaceae bacterium]|jgi:UDP-GlcNAc:undecaprenyl-phosphate GlcNAc-1-phosphate transferase|nr:undecaprenyl/decaprenyl-phosphate alpha-N-acetylglucosaminyl 1-phosphate transferase [Bifidobacteriaceae bacterium]